MTKRWLGARCEKLAVALAPFTVALALMVTGLAPAAFAGRGTCLQLSGSRLVASDLAKKDARLAALDPHADLGYLPEPGERRTLALPGGGSVCVERAMAPLTEEGVRAALDLPPGVRASASVVAFSITPVPVGQLRFPAAGVSPPARGADTVLWRGAVEYEPGRTVAVWAQVRLRREASCLRAKADLPRGQRWTSGQAESVPCDAAAILAEAVVAERDIDGMQAARTIRKGDWLIPEAFTDVPLVAAKREAILELRSGAARLVLPVVPEETGTAGQRIWVRNPATRERLRAEVVGTDSLLLVLPGHTPRQAARATGRAEGAKRGRLR